MKCLTKVLLSSVVLSVSALAFAGTPAVNVGKECSFDVNGSRDINCTSVGVNQPAVDTAKAYTDKRIAEIQKKVEALTAERKK